MSVTMRVQVYDCKGEEKESTYITQSTYSNTFLVATTWAKGAMERTGLGSYTMYTTKEEEAPDG